MVQLSSGATILVVEDDEGMREALVNLLEVAGFKVASYPCAEALLADGAHDEALCIVSDFKLPGMSGLQLLDALRSHRSKTPVIVITAHDTPSVRNEATQHGAAACFAKPFQRDALLAAIEAIAT